MQTLQNRCLLDELEEYLKGKYACVMPEFVFHPKRKYRFDFAILSLPDNGTDKIAVEIEGGIYSKGRHTRGAGYQSDLTKYNLATSLGWKVYRFSYDDLKALKYREFL